MYDYQLASVTIYKSKFYSDNKTETEPYINTDNAIEICASCNNVFWFDGAVLDIENPYELLDTVPKTIDIVDFLFKMDGNYSVDLIEFYEKLLKQGFAHTNEKKYYLRMRLWWAINNLVRYQSSIFNIFTQVVSQRKIYSLLKNRIEQRRLFKSFKGLFRENIEQLILLVNPNDEESNYLLAETNREIGKFKTANTYIKKVVEKNSLSVKKLKRAIFFRKKEVFQF